MLLLGPSFIILHRNYGGMPHCTLHLPLKLPNFLIQCLLCIRSGQAQRSFAGFIAVWEAHPKPSTCPDTTGSPRAPITSSTISLCFTHTHFPSHPTSLALQSKYLLRLVFCKFIILAHKNIRWSAFLLVSSQNSPHFGR